MKNMIYIITQVLSLTYLTTDVLEAATLKVYNMSDRVQRGSTNPISDCGHGRSDCAIFPYQSIFHSNTVTFKLPLYGIQEFYWQEIVGPRYKITVNLQKDEYQTLELYGGSAYKFKGKMKYAVKD